MPNCLHKSTRIGIFLGVCWLYACIHLDRQILGILAESVKSDLHLQDQQLGALTGSAFSIVYALLGLYFGNLSDRSDRLNLVRVGAYIWSLSCIGAAFAPGYSALVASRAGVAVGEAIATAAAVSLIAELAGERYRARLASLFLTSAFIGAGAAAFVGGAIVDSFRHAAFAAWRPALFLAGTPGIIGAIYLRAFRSAEPVRPRRARSRDDNVSALVLVGASLGALVLQMRLPPSWGVPLALILAGMISLWWTRRLRVADPPAYLATLGQQPFRWLVAAFAAVLFVDYAAGFWFIPLAQRRFGVGAAAVGAQLGALMLGGGIAGCLLGGWIADRWHQAQRSGRVWTALVAILVEGAAIWFAAGEFDYHAFLVAFGVLCVGSGGWTGVAAALAFDLVPREHRGTGTAAYFLATTLLGPGLGPFLVGLGSDAFGSLGTALAVSCTPLVFGAIALLRLTWWLDRPALLKIPAAP